MEKGHAPKYKSNLHNGSYEKFMGIDYYFYVCYNCIKKPASENNEGLPCGMKVLMMWVNTSIFQLA